MYLYFGVWQYISIRAENDTILHIPDESDQLKEDFSIVIGLHGLGDNYPDNFQVSSFKLSP